MDPVRTDQFSDDPARGYAFSGKIMLSAIVVLFFVIILMVCLHLYARWYLLRARRRHVQRARNRRMQLVFYVDPNNPNGPRVTLASRGLDETVLKALPIFTYSSETHPDPIECAVCLSEFEDKETGRTLPKCNHSFHVECIDMWFHTHSTCPLCRSPVEAPENPVELVTESGSEVAGSGSGSSPGMCAASEHEEESVGAASTSSFEGRRKPVELMGVTIEVPRRNGGFDQDESTTESPASQAYRSPMSRMLSFKRILSRDRRGSCSSSCGVELDLERGPANSVLN